MTPLGRRGAGRWLPRSSVDIEVGRKELAGKTRTMRVDVALMVYSLRGGGVERMRIHLANALNDRGYRADIVVARGDGPYLSHISPGVRLVDLQAHSWRDWLNSLITYLKNEEPRVLLAAMESAGVIALWARRRAGVASRVVVSSHIEISRHVLNERKRLKRLLIPYLVRRLYRSADGVVAVSNGVADSLARFGRLPKSSIRVIYNPVVTEELIELSRKEEEHPWLSTSDFALIVGVGRLTAQKDFATLLRSFAHVRSQRKARLLILGEGKARASLEMLVRELGVEEWVQMPGFVANPFAYMARASLCVLSSTYEGLPGVMIQALACGCPVVSTDCPSGPREILQDGKYGGLVPVGDHQALARAILETLDNPPDPNILRARAMDFHVDKIVDRYLEAMGLQSQRPCEVRQPDGQVGVPQGPLAPIRAGASRADARDASNSTSALHMRRWQGEMAGNNKIAYSISTMDWYADEVAVLDLLQASMPGDTTRWSNEALWHWKHLQNPFGKSLALVAKDVGTGKIVGLRAFMAWRYLVGGAPVLAYRPVDTATDPSYRRMGIFSRLTLQALDRARQEGAVFLFNTPNQMSVGGYLRMGWTLVAQARANIRVCNYARFALKVASNRLSRGNGSEIGPLPSRDDGSVAVFLSNEAAAQGLIASDAAWRRNQIFTQRSAQYLWWRFGKHPVHSYSAVQVGDVDGVCFSRRIKRDGLSGLLLEDIILRSPNPKTVVDLVKNMQLNLKPDFMMAYAPPGSCEHWALKSCGFRWTAKSRTNFVSNALATDLPVDPTKLANWSLSMCDIEFF